MARREPKVLNVGEVEPSKGTTYPPPFDRPCLQRAKAALGDLFGLNDFGVNWVSLPAGDWSAQRHWHSSEDEFLFILSGSPTLVMDEGEKVLKPGDFVGFPAGVENGHHLKNLSDETAVYLEMGSRKPEADACHYPDIDLHLPAPQSAGRFKHKDGRPYDT
ncbi:MAG: cupin domain-containing protein [Kiloniellales bacterium]|nr:cupin domain-containing protein [Kiloniellales bacterium]